MDKLYEESLLFDFYGELLTEHQKRAYEEVVMGDYSLAEVAEELGISRQGVHDLVRRSRAALQGYEDKLQLMRKFLAIRKDATQILEATEDKTIRALAQHIIEEL